MMKKYVKICCVLATTILLIVPVANAQGNNVDVSEDQVVESIKIDSDLLLQKKADGRVNLVSNSKNINLSDAQQDQILKEMRFTEDEIKAMGPSVKENLALNGGVKVDVQTKLVQYFNSSDGNRYLVTDQNREQIEALRQMEAEKLGEQLNKEISIQPLSSMGSVVDGIFSASGYVTYQGRNSTEFEYRYTDSFAWSKTPQNLYDDTIAHAWQTQGTSIFSDGQLTTKWLGNKDYHNLMVTPEGVYGSSAKVRYSMLFEEMTGYLANHVRIPVSYKGTTGRFVAKFAHPWSIIQPSISVGAISISFGPFIGDEWSWESTFNITDNPNEL